MNNKQKPNSNWSFLMKYASLGTQLLVSIGTGFFLGYQTDKWLHTMPVLSCVLPLLVLIAIFYKLFRETRIKKGNE
jgi:F0F1-type ATP synthase assembly protein I